MAVPAQKKKEKKWTTGAQSPIVEVRKLTKRFGDREAVQDIDLRIYPGECLGLLGPNGAGKTTIINMLLGLVTPTSGEIRIFGEPIPKQLKQAKSRIGVIPQADNLDPDLSVLENLLTYSSYYRIGRSTARERADELLNFFALKNRSDEIIQNLSGGLRRRLLLARALVNSPGLLILDEPTIGLDPQARHLIWERLDTLRAQGTTMLLTSHYMEEVSKLADRIFILDEGKVVAEGNPIEMVTDIVGMEVFEMTDSPEGLDAMENAIRQCNVNIEKKGDRLLIYVREPCPELEALAVVHRQISKRQTNLEDLFLKLTGRKLRQN